MSDVPLGVFLSGGIDSSAITAVMRTMTRAPIKTFSVAFAEREANELNYSRAVARAFKTVHHETVVTPEEFFGALPALVYQEDEPIAHPSSVPLYFVSKLARRHVKVVLTGEGSDELLAGYNKYRVTIENLRLGRHYQSIVPAWARQMVKRRIEKRSSFSRVLQKLRRTFLCLPAEIRDIYFDNFAVFSPLMQNQLFTPEILARMGDGDPYRDSLKYIDDSDAGKLTRPIACR